MSGAQCSECKEINDHTPTCSLKPRELPPLPPQMRSLPVDRRGYPVPWFVWWNGPEPDFRITAPGKRERAFGRGLCWVCGKPLKSRQTFVIGPMCVVSRVSSEPPCHEACAEYSAKACPFLTRPHMKRQDKNIPEEALATPQPGIPLKRNPGVCVLWTSNSYKHFQDAKDAMLIDIGHPIAIRTFCEGRAATIEEITHSIETGLPSLVVEAQMMGEAAVIQLQRQTQEAIRLLGPA